MSITNSLPAPVTAGIRVVYQVVTSGLVASGKLSPESAEGILAIVLAVAAFGWGMYKTHDREKRASANGGA